VNSKPVWEQLRRLAPIQEVPVDWDASGYTTRAFNETVAETTFEGWDGDLPADEEAAVIAGRLRIDPGGSVLDVACGYGRHARVFAERYGLRVTGIDIAPGLIEKARRDAARAGLDIAYTVGHARDLGWVEVFDGALVAFNTFSVFSPEDAPRVLAGIRRALKPGGRFFLDLDNKPVHCRYGSCRRKWYLGADGVVLQDVWLHEDRSVEVTRDVYISPAFDRMTEFLCFKRIYSADEVGRLLEDAGFQTDETYGNWDLTPLAGASPKILLVARKR